jgi:hypothetical protein
VLVVTHPKFVCIHWSEDSILGIIQLWFPVVMVAATGKEHERIVKAARTGRRLLGKAEMPA